MIGLEGKILKSSRLSYRLLNSKDIDDLFCLLRDESVTKPAGFLPAGSMEAFQDFYAQLTQYHTGIAILLQQQLIGYFHVNKYVIDREEFQGKACVSVGFVIGKAYQNRGFGTEALRFLTEYLLTLFDVCVADAFVENVPSKKVIQNSGYTYLEDYSMYFDGIQQEKTCSSYVRLRG